jgi:hypothetical protein
MESLLAIILQLPLLKTRLRSISLLRSSHPGRLASRNSTRLDYYSLPLNRPYLSLYIPSIRTPRKTMYSIIKKTCLYIRCLARDVLLLSAFVCADVSTESLPSNAYTRHSIIRSDVKLSCNLNLRIVLFPAGLLTKTLFQECKHRHMRSASSSEFSSNKNTFSLLAVTSRTSRILLTTVISCGNHLVKCFNGLSTLLSLWSLTP